VSLLGQELGEATPSVDPWPGGAAAPCGIFNPAQDSSAMWVPEDLSVIKPQQQGLHGWQSCPQEGFCTESQWEAPLYKWARPRTVWLREGALAVGGRQTPGVAAAG
jgi:hypothetical protein